MYKIITYNKALNGAQVWRSSFLRYLVGSGTIQILFYVQLLPQALLDLKY